MWFKDSMSIAQQVMPIYNTTTHKNKSNLSLTLMWLTVGVIISLERRDSQWRSNIQRTWRYYKGQEKKRAERKVYIVHKIFFKKAP